MVSTAIGAWAKFKIRVERQMRTSASANAAKTIPSTRPDSAVLTNCSNGFPLSPSSEAQVGVSELLVGGQGRCVVVGDDPAEVQHDAPVGHRQGAASVLLDEQDRSGPRR